MFRFAVVILLLLGLVVPAAAQQRDTIFTLPDEIGSIAPDETIEADLTEETPLHVYAFEAEEGEAFSFLVVDPQFYTSYVAITDEEGTVITASTRDPLSEGSARIVLFIAPEDATYLVLVTTGGYGFSQRHSVDSSFTVTMLEAEYETLELGDEVEISLDEETPRLLFALPLERTDIPQIILETRNAEITVGSVYNENFSPRSGNTTVGSTNIFISPFYMQDEDTLYIMVTAPRFGNREAEAKLIVRQYEAAQIADGETVSVSIAPETLSNFIQFEGDNGQTVTLEAEAAESIDAQLAVFDPEGRVIAVESAADGVRGLRLRTGGTYTIMVFPGGFMVDLSGLGEVAVTLSLR